VRLGDAHDTDTDIGERDRHPARCRVLVFDASDAVTDTGSEHSPISESGPNPNDVADPDPSDHIADIAAANSRLHNNTDQREFPDVYRIQLESNRRRGRWNRHVAQCRHHRAHLDGGQRRLELWDDSSRRIIQHAIPDARHIHVSLRDSPQYGWDRHRAVAGWMRGSRASSGTSY
jgi:hypothetical protein